MTRYISISVVITEADTCRKYVLPKLYAAGWNDDQISEQKSFTDGRIIPVGVKGRRRPCKRADYLLRYARDFMLAVVEAKAAYKLPGDGLQQAKDYATVLGLKFAYSTNGHGIVEFDFTTGAERQLDAFPKPAELWQRFRTSEKIEDEEAATRLLTPANAAIGKGQRYYQEIAINRVVQSVLQGKKRILLTMATGTGKTAVAFQICWKLWNMRWNRAGEHRRPKDSLSRRPKYFDRRSQGQNVHDLRRCALEDRERRSEQGPRDLFRHLPGHRQGRKPARPLQGILARIFST